MISHNGYFGCRICEFEGIYNSSDRTCTSLWPIFVQTYPHFRARDRFESCLKEVDYLKSIGSTNVNICGIKGVSPLNRFLFIPTQAIYDYFHLCLEVDLLLYQLILANLIGRPLSGNKPQS